MAAERHAKVTDAMQLISEAATGSATLNEQSWRSAMSVLLLDLADRVTRIAEDSVRMSAALDDLGNGSARIVQALPENIRRKV